MTAVTSIIHSGVCTHSSDTFWREYAVFSVGADPVRDNQFRNWCLSNGVVSKALFGCYKGQTETSFMVPAEMLPKVADAGFLVGQESVLYLGKPVNLGGGQHYRPATLLFVSTGAVEDIGHFVQRHRDHAIQQEAWTYDPLTNAHFICVPDARPKARRKAA